MENFIKIVHEIHLNNTLTRKTQIEYRKGYKNSETINTNLEPKTNILQHLAIHLTDSHLSS